MQSAADVLEKRGKQQAPDPSSLNNPKLGQFKIIKMTMRDASEGSNNQGVFWSNSDWDMANEDE